MEQNSVHTHTDSLIYNKGDTVVQWGKKDFFSWRELQSQLDSIGGREESWPLFTMHTKINSRWIAYLSVKVKGKKRVGKLFLKTQ